MKDVLVMGSAVLDVTAMPIEDQSSWKEKQRVDSISAAPGGDAVNQSIRLADAGCTVDLCCSLGDDSLADFLETFLTKRGVDISHITRRKDVSTTSALVLVDGNGERHTFSVKGAHRYLDKTSLETIHPEDYHAISLASLFSMPVLEEDGLLDFLKQVHALPDSRRPLVFADLGSDKAKQGIAGIERFLPYLDYFLPSIYDAENMTGLKDRMEITRYFQKKGVGTVVLKCGADGCFCLQGEKGFLIPAAHVHPVDTTGAGDTFVAFLISQIIKKMPLHSAIHFANIGATLSTMYLGASNIKISEEEIKHCKFDS